MRATVAVLSTLLLAAPAAAQTTLKIATLAPEGSAWMKLSHDWQAAVEKRTEGRVKIKFYAGGVHGDERDVIRKIRLGQLSGGSLTGIGLSSIAPEARALEIARTYEQLDGLRAAVGGDIKKYLEQKGWILVGWGDVGPVQLFSKKPVKTLEDMRQLKLWLWGDDPISRQLFTALGLRGVPLGVPEVLPGLSTGQIDAFFGSPLATLALQWAAHARFVTSMVLSQATGATILAKKAWEAIAPADQKIILEEAATMQQRVLEQVRLDNKKSMEVMRKQGLELVEITPALQAELDKAAEQVARARGADVPKEFQDKVQKLVDDYRAGAKTKR